MAGLAIRMVPETMRTIAFGAISGVYAGVGTAFANPIRIIHLLNTTDVLLTFSFDGINDHFVLPINGYILLDITANKTIVQGFYIAEGQRVYVKGTPGSGSVYLSTWYGVE